MSSAARRTAHGHGHSIEARLYAEDPAQGWQPQAGTVHRFEVPAATTQFGLTHRTGIRLDSGIVDGSVVSIHYDPMLAKVISYAPTRARAAAVLADALARTRLHGLRTNRDLLVNVLRHPAFLAGATDTAFFDTHGLDVLAAPLADERAVRLSAHRRRRRRRRPQPRDRRRSGRSAQRMAQRRIGQSAQGFPGRRPAPSTGRLPVHPNGSAPARRSRRRSGVGGARRGGARPTDGVATAFAVARYGDDVYVDSARGPVALTALPRFPEPGSAVGAGSLLAPMPGSVIRLGRRVGRAL